ncbi:DUF4945 domain-containing protein [Sunxiuqinia sp. A32]|uniref:DUF4945 domain-containing protein n=1 Tax=Sunxiuqinia sp. A32 TaxID=3461496 RepID=UPI004045470D
MKRITFLIILAFLFIMSSCEYEIIDSKPGEPIAPVTNLTSSISGNSVALNWNLPSSYPSDIIQPVSVYIKVTKDGNNAGSQVLNNNPNTFVYDAYESGHVYRFTVKVRANVDTDDPNFSDLRYSEGETIEL